MEAANIYETFLGVRLCDKPAMIFPLNPQEHLGGSLPFC